MTRDATHAAKIVGTAGRQVVWTAALVIELQRVPAPKNCLLRSFGRAEFSPRPSTSPLLPSPARGEGREGQQEKRGCSRRPGSPPQQQFDEYI
jgi:hypothetical protein